MNKKKKDFLLTNLCVALECGGSDQTSGLFTNPVIGMFVDYLIENNIAEFPNYIKIDVDGLEHIILNGGLKLLLLFPNSSNQPKPSSNSSLSSAVFSPS